MPEALQLGLALVLRPESVGFLVVGTFIGVFVGAMPGLSSTVGLAILLPFTYALSPAQAVLLMIALYMAAEYGGSITAIVIGVPGTPPAFATTFDGHPLALRGQASKALGVSIVSSALGGIFGTIILMLAFGPIAKLALAFGPAEYFSLGVFGLSIVANVTGTRVVKGLISVVIGLLLFVVGLDVLSGYPRFTFRSPALLDGIGLVPAFIGLFAIAEVFKAIACPTSKPPSVGSVLGRLPTWNELWRLGPTVLRSSAIGAIIGAIPGAGATIASLVAWNEEKRLSKTPEQFGTGILEGISAPESANNSAVAASLIPLLTLGVPGSASSAIILGGLMLQGINPGPLLVLEHGELVYAIYFGFLLAALCMFLVGLAAIPIWVRIIGVDRTILVPLILGISIVGAYTPNQRLFDVGLAVFFGALGFAMSRFGFPLMPTVLGLVLGFMLEANYRRALALSGGDHMTFLTHPISLVLLLLSAASFTAPLIRRRLTAGKSMGDAV